MEVSRDRPVENPRQTRRPWTGRGHGRVSAPWEPAVRRRRRGIPGPAARLHWRSLVAFPQARGGTVAVSRTASAKPTGRAPPLHAGLKRGRGRPDILDCPSSHAERRVPVVTQAPVKGLQAVKVNFALPKDAVAGNVSVVGDFNGWDPFAHPLRPRRDGTRSTVVTLPPRAPIRVPLPRRGWPLARRPNRRDLRAQRHRRPQRRHPHLAARLGPGHRRLRPRPQPAG